MNEYFLFSIIFLVALVLGIFLGNLISRLKSRTEKILIQEKIDQLLLRVEDAKSQIQNNLDDHKNELSETKALHLKQIEKLENEREEIRREKDFLSTELTRRNSEFENLQQRNTEQKAEVEQLQEKFQKEFENLANKILDQKSEKFTSLNKENIQNILSPLQEKIKNFEEKVNQNNTDFISRHAELGKQLKDLNEQNLKISEEANNLTKALKGESKTQGNWGELILERVLEKSGLQRDREYFIQKAYEDENGNKVLPDVVIHLPNDKRMIIDSKVSLSAYEKYVNEENEISKARHLKDHLKSLQNHILQLSSKKYEDLHGSDSPDFVLMFVPVEPALYLAQECDNGFFYTAFQKNILLVSPTTLLSTLRTIDTIWSNEKQQQNAVEIANHAASLYHKFKILIDELEVVGNRIKSTSSAYDSAMKKLTGQQNLIKDIDKLESLGISPKQKISSKWLDEASFDRDEEQDDITALNQIKN
ncbi:DNA recombination protein RmuC [Autumnicola psychrophila]|uniref:DNA recombination protein RmuC n=1 Tax=Autumnicola psychrophila TaxID=3075592 RepID=A0ABU3DSL9_9FLAO|nr:DNA recombination protein RmuC [Zunongwangia sp. F225]MDT0686707.1 DNA recombination protein RmuC [Zunongwangia sp. F225]